MSVIRTTLLVFVSIVLLLFSPACAGEFKVAVIKSDGPLPYDEVVAGFRAELQGQHVSLIFVDGIDNRSVLAGKISVIRPAAILCLGSRALESVSDIKDVPKIFCLVTLSKAYTLAGRQDIYGVTIDIPFAMQFKIIKNILPKVRRIGVIYNPEHNQKLIVEAEKSAHAMGLQLVTKQVHSIKDIPHVLQMLEDKIDLLWSIYDQTAYGPETAKYILVFALKQNIPFVGFSPQFAKVGALLSLYGDYEDMGHQAALIVKKFLSDEEPSYKRLEPRRTRIAVNEKVARALAISFPDNFLKTVSIIY
jgi:putative tryptophan/tyrosine transport system substrate-binding protein